MTKHLFAVIAALGLLCFACTGCSGASSSAAEQAQTPSLTQVIAENRTEEMNTAYPIAAGSLGTPGSLSSNPAGASEEDAAAQNTAMLEALGMQAEGLTEYAVSLSLDDAVPYAIGIFRPADSYEELVKAAAVNYVITHQKLFTDEASAEYAIVQKGLVETMDNGDILLVMCEGSDDIAQAIKDAVAQLPV